MKYTARKIKSMFAKTKLLSFAILLLTLLLCSASVAYADDAHKVAEWDISELSTEPVSASLYEYKDGYALRLDGEGFVCFDTAPWNSYAERIYEVTVGRGVLNIPSGAFILCTNLSVITMDEPEIIFLASESELPITALIYAHRNSTAEVYANNTNPMRLRYCCSFSDGICTVCGYECASHSGGTAICGVYAECETCGEKYGAPGAHPYTELIGKQAATCIDDGMLAHYGCRECDMIFDASYKPVTADELRIPASHNLGNLVPYQKPTCDGVGYPAHYLCSACDEYLNENMEIFDRSAIPALGHSGGDADCVTRATCDVCGEQYGVFDSNDHSFSDLLLHNDEEHWYECACGEKSLLTAHQLYDLVIKEASETEDGEIESACVCGYSVTTVIPKLGSDSIPPVDDGTDRDDANTDGDNSGQDNGTDGDIDTDDGFPWITVFSALAVISVCVAVAMSIIYKRRVGKKRKSYGEGDFVLADVEPIHADDSPTDDSPVNIDPPSDTTGM